VDRAFLTVIENLRQCIDPVEMFRLAVGDPDPWQQAFLRSRDPLTMALCFRGAGKSSASSVLLAHQVLTEPNSLCLAIAPSERQSRRILKLVLDVKEKVRLPVHTTRSTMSEVEFDNGSVLISLPASSDTIRGYHGAKIILHDECCFYGPNDDVVLTSFPMRAKDGRILLISTPQPGNTFHDLWEEGAANKIKVLADDIPRLAEEVAFARARFPKWKFEQEYGVSFSASRQNPFFDPDALEKAFVDAQPLFV
jgi:hypothetical protein